MLKPLELNAEILKFTAIIAGDFDPNTGDVVEYTRRFGSDPAIGRVNDVLKLALCITDLKPDPSCYGTKLYYS